ncbi:MAG: homoserine kinase [Vulcanimicrobiota bacterium]
MDSFTVKVPATSANMGPGYDTIGMALNIYNEFSVTVGGKERLSIAIEGEGADELPKDDTNLVYRSFLKGCALARARVPNISLVQKNAIPVARGLGSSASAIIAGLVIAKKVFGEALSEEILVNAAAELEGHPDNTMAAYYGGVVINYLENRHYSAVKIHPSRPMEIALAIPEIKIKSREARELLPEQYPIDDVVATIRNMALLIASLYSGDYRLLGTALKDRIHQPYRAKLLPGFYEAVEASCRAGAWGAALSGSGSTTIAFCPDNPESAAKAMMQVYAEKGICCTWKTASLIATGAVIIP